MENEGTCDAEADAGAAAGDERDLGACVSKDDVSVALALPLRKSGRKTEADMRRGGAGSAGECVARGLQLLSALRRRPRCGWCAREGAGEERGG